MVDLILFLVAILASVGITGLMRSYAQRRNLLDVPNQRSSHQVATPRGGGISIVVVFLGTVVGLYLFDELPTDSFLALFVGGILVAGVGFVDDHDHVSASWRFVIQSIAAIFAIGMLGGLPEVQLGRTLVDLGLVGDMMAILFAVWFINLYNFMDGIDGIAAVEAVSIVAGALCILLFGENSFISTLLIVFAATVLGFLVWNWPPAKIFMGDVGSGFVGFVLVILAVVSAKPGLVSFWVWLILAGVFIVDSTVTLITRVLHREEWYSAHNNHAYQKAARRLGGHRPVTIAVLTINVLWLLPIAWYASARPASGWWLTLIAWVPLIAISRILGAGRPDAAA